MFCALPLITFIKDAKLAFENDGSSILHEKGSYGPYWYITAGMNRGLQIWWIYGNPGGDYCINMRQELIDEQYPGLSGKFLLMISGFSVNKYKLVADKVIS